MLNAPPAAACPPVSNGMTCSRTFGIADAASSASICSRSTARPPIGRRSTASSSTAHSFGAPSRCSTCWRVMRSFARRSISVRVAVPCPSMITARAYASVCSSPGTNCTSYVRISSAACSRSR
jgi:hypothetical protein